MITFGLQSLSPFYNSSYDIHSAKPTKHFTDILNLSDQVNRNGSEWVRSVNDNLTLIQSFSDFYNETLLSNLALVDLTNRPLDLPRSASDTITFSDSFDFAGHLWTAQNGIETIFDSNTEKGMAVYITGLAHAELAKANNALTTECVGLARDAITAGSIGAYLTSGQLEKFDWTAVTGVPLLIPGAIYYLSKDVVGRIAPIAPINVGEYVVRIGKAITAYMLSIEIVMEAKL